MTKEATPPACPVQRIRTFGAVAVALLLGVVAAACGSTGDSVAEPSVSDATTVAADGEQPSSTTTTALTTSTTEGTTTAAPASTEAPSTTVQEAGFLFDDPVTLIDAGQEPREVLRFSYLDGEELMNMRQTQVLGQTLDGELLTPDTTSVMDSVSRIIVVGQDDVFRVESVVESVSVPPESNPETAELLEAELQSLLGTSTLAILDDRGLVGAAQSSGVGDEVVDEVVDAVSNMSNPLPVEALGLGAVWQTLTVLEVFGLQVDQIQESTLIARDGDIVTIEWTVSQEVAPGSEGKIGDSPFEVIFWEIIGDGRAVIDLSLPTPVESVSSVGGRQTLNIDGQTLDQKLATDLEINRG